MPPRKSAGILLYKIKKEQPHLFLVHPGGPFWTNKDNGAWTIPKGEFTADDQPLNAAQREFSEETGATLTGTFMELTPIIQKAGKMVYAWAIEGDINAAAIKSNTFKVQWPPKSGKWQTFPEVNKAAWFTIAEAKQKINPAQIAFIDELVQKLQTDANKQK